MPFTPYHFGPGGFVGLTLRKYLDIPTLLLANVAVDVEVLFASGWAVHRHWHFHTLLIGAVVGVGAAIAAYPLRPVFRRIMKLLRIPYEPAFWKMLVSGVLGVWLHVAVDAIYHWDVQILWPQKTTPLWRLLSKQNVKIACVAFALAAIIPYAYAVKQYLKKQEQGSKVSKE